jgi:hypothetical protein
VVRTGKPSSRSLIPPLDGRFPTRERGTVTIKVTRKTRFERINGLAGMRVGMRRVESIARRSNGAWIALEVERSGGGGEHGGRGDRGVSGPGG